MRYLYLAVNIGAIVIPLIFSFHPKINFYKHFRTVLTSMALVAVPLTAWDIYFTKIGVWGFDPEYLIGFYIFNLPLEEIMFFIFIPFSCVFTYYTLRKNLIRNFEVKLLTPVFISLGLFLFIFSFFFYGKYYTSWVFALTGLAMILSGLFFKKYLTAFLVSYLILLIPFFIVNGILTGLGIQNEIVWYNNAENLGVRILTIPIEDFFYCLLLILMNVVVFEKLRERYNTSKT